MSRPDDDFVMVRRTTVGLGTFISIEAAAAAGGGRPLDDACSVFAAVEAAMHPTRDSSDLVAIARAAPGERVEVHDATFQVLSFAEHLWRATDGLFDPCVPEQPGRLGDLELIEPRVVRRRGPRVAIDLGGLAKGFAIDRAIDALRAAGCVSGLVNAGGDVRVFGNAGHVIEIRVEGALPLEVLLENEALAVSAPKSSRSPSEHRGFYSPLTGQQVLAHPVAIRAPTATVADALTKCAILCRPELLQHLLSAYDAHLVSLRQNAASKQISPCTPT